MTSQSKQLRKQHRGLFQGVGATGVVLNGANGPIEGEVINFKDGTTDGIDVTTDGFAAWPSGTTAAHAGPGLSYETQGDSNQGEEGQTSFSHLESNFREC